MSQGINFLSSAIRTNNRLIINRLQVNLLDPRVSAGETVSERDFYNFIQDHIGKYRQLPNLQVLRDNNMPYREVDQPPEYYLEKLKQRSVYNAYAQFTKQMAPLLTQSDWGPAYELINELSRVVSSINMSDRYKSIADIGREIETQIENRKTGSPEVFIPFGWPTLDQLTGGLAGGDLAYFIARPGIGKTNVLTYIAHNAWKQGFSPMLLTMEMTDVQIARRIYGLEAQFNPDTVRRGIPEKVVEDKLHLAIGAFDDGPDFHIVCGQVKQTVESITALVDELQPDVLFIDAAYLVSMNGPAKSTWEKLAVVSERLKQVAITRNIPIIMTVQFNRDAAKGKRYELDTIAGSDAIGQLGSVIVSIRQGDDQHEHDRRVLNIIKNREGGVDEFEIHNRFDPPDFSEITRNVSGTTSSEVPFEL